ncbi:hypothetical protein DOY81_000848 [Sarcophaga bullata]|nr:hypothetical protein DOY81_000848 [Sarcophaga bullata]
MKMKMAFKTFYYSLWMFIILFTLVKAHGKRSSNTKIYRTDLKPATEVDFQDLNALNEKNNYDSQEEQINAVHDNSHDGTKETESVNEPVLKTDTRFKKFFYKQLNKNVNKQNSLEPTEYNFQKNNNGPVSSERWRRLPFYNNLRRIQLTKADNDWLRELERETQQQQQQQNNEEDYI